MTTSDWDEPQPARIVDHGADAGRRAARADGLLSPVAFLSFLLANFFKIALVGIAAAVAGSALVYVTPFPYRAVATVLVDPRNEQVTLQENVLTPIGSDAAILESMVQILKSDGFLLGVMNQMGIAGDQPGLPTEEDQLRALAKFKKALTVERMGATYLVQVGFNDTDRQEAARIANSVAASFAATQNGYLSDATTKAAQALSGRLVELRASVNRSEKAVADFAAQRGIIYVDGQNTLQQRQLTDLSAQLAISRKATEDAVARYNEQITANRSGLTLSTEGNQEPEQLRFLRQQRTQLMQTLQQQSLTYGDNHPRITEAKRLIAGIEQQIRDERETLVRQLKGSADVAAAQQAALESKLTQLSAGLSLTDADMVQLEALRREAAADRTIYEQFLSRNKQTDELAALKTENVRVVSPAVPPLRSSRPSLMLVAPILGLLGGALALVFLALRSHRSEPRGPVATVRPVVPAAPPVPEPAAPTTTTVTPSPSAPVAEVAPEPARPPSLLMIDPDKEPDAAPATPPVATARGRSTSLLMLDRAATA